MIRKELYGMKRTAGKILLLCAAIVTTGCAAVVIGAGAGAGVYTYVKGELTRPYPKDFDHIESATLESLAYLKIVVDEKVRQGSETIIKARQKDGEPVTVKVQKIRDDMTEVAVRCGHVGYWNRENAELIHATILNTM